MTWLVLEIFAFVAAAVIFGVLIGLGLSAAGANRRALGFEREHRGQLDRIEALEQSQLTVETRAEARSAAEAAVRGDLEGSLAEFEAAAARYRARAEAAERQVRVMQSPHDPAAAAAVVRPASPHDPRAEQAEIESLRKAIATAEAARSKAELDLCQAQAERDAVRSAAAVARGGAEAESLQRAQEIESLGAQLAAAERVRAHCEAELALAHTRAEAVLRSAAALLDPGSSFGAAANSAETQALGGGNGASSTPFPTLNERDRPPSLAVPRGGRPDDLRRIRGIGPRNESVLNALGVYHFEQIAALSPANMAWLDAYFRFHGRIAREDWVGQAKVIVEARARPEFSDKVHPEDAGF
ncbi:MAG: hypothetical protein ACREIP_02410 [Alphaproteobacteria bacterium]